MSNEWRYDPLAGAHLELPDDGVYDVLHPRPLVLLPPVPAAPVAALVVLVYLDITQHLDISVLSTIYIWYLYISYLGRCTVLSQPTSSWL